ncbi:Dioxygenase [Planctomycetes bacterium Poly30]|uniref:Dioxygenase n=1 Tax=Saltatorellus ferox TaxID=2528018 RepID=A0A518ENS1_9BACT|nr:Dioxygenase [Planctomycetes bacterium Poly30]
MQLRSLLAVAAVVLIAAVGWFVLRTEPTAAPIGTIEQSLQPPDAPSPQRGDELAELGVRAAASDSGREAVAVAPIAVDSIEEEHPWAGMLAGLTGRLVEKDGTPVPSMRVELIEADASVLFGSEHAALGTPELEIGETFTDSEGRFLFEGARDGSFHALNIDRGGGRATIRLVEQSVENRTLTDLGDIVLDEYGTLIGTVIDEDGEPVEGARVRATVIPEIVVQTGVLDVREGIVVTSKDEAEEGGLAIEPPRSAFALLDRIPIPTTTTLADGSFRLEGVPLGRVSGGVDLPGHIAATIGPIEVTPTEVDVGELELLFGRTVTGTVKDLAGEPVSGVSVCAGAMHPLFGVAIMQPGGVTDENGLFSVPGVPENGSLVGAIRRHRSERWTLGEATPGTDTIDFVLPTAGKIICTLLDEEEEPVPGADILVRLSAESGNEMAWMTNIALAGRMPMMQTKAKATETPGVYVVEDLSLGKWTIEARVPGRATVRKEVEHRGGETLVRMQSPKGQMLRVVVTDEITGEPIKSAHATLLGPEGFLFTAFASAFTGKDGSTELGPLAPAWRDQALANAVWMKDTIVSVEHPEYGKSKMTVPEGVTEVAIAMPPACTIEGVVTWGGGSPGNVYMVTVRWNDDSDPMAQFMMLPRTALTNLEGRFKVTGLAPGDYEVVLMERYFEGNPLQLLLDQKEPTMVDKTSVAVEPEAPAVLAFDLSVDGQGPSGTFEGRVTVDGNAISGAEVKVGRRDPDVYYTDGFGEFETEPYSIINSQRIVIVADVPTADGGTAREEVYNNWQRPKDGEVTRIDVELSYTPIRIQVVDAATGAGVPDVKLRLSGEGRWRGRRGGNDMKTDSRGEADTVLPDKKTYSLVATSKLYAQASVQVSAGTVKDGLVRIEMRPAVPCAGRVTLPSTVETQGKMYLNVTAPGFEGDWAEIDREELTFELARMAPGDYEARVWSGPTGGMLTTKFTLQEGGDTGLLLEFVAEGEAD